MSKTQKLGRGLSALLGAPRPQSENYAGSVRNQIKLPLAYLKPSPHQPRSYFSEGHLQDLAESIKQKGILQPIIVRPGSEKDTYEIIAGERRWRAAQKAGLHEVPVIIRELSDADVIQVAIIENVQRTDLSAVDEARSYQRLIDEFNNSQEDVARMVGKSRSHVANILRLLSLPADVIRLLEEEKMTMGHARALIGTNNPSELAKRILAENMSVRDIEKLAFTKKKTAPNTRKISKNHDANTVDLERRISQSIGVPVLIKHKGNQGQLIIKYTSLEQLDDICLRFFNT